MRVGAAKRWKPVAKPLISDAIESSVGADRPMVVCATEDDRLD